MVREESGMPVVVAGHPNSELDERFSEKMGDRKVVYGNTAALALAFHGTHSFEHGDIICCSS